MPTLMLEALTSPLLQKWRATMLHHLDIRKLIVASVLRVSVCAANQFFLLDLRGDLHDSFGRPPRPVRGIVIVSEPLFD